MTRPRGAGAAGSLLLATVLGVCALALLLGFTQKLRCGGPPYNQFGQSDQLGRLKYTDFCYSDIQQLYPFRGIREHVLPYVHGDLPRDGQLGRGSLEYPVLTGVFIWATSWLAHNDTDFLTASALLLAPFGMLTGWLLAQLTGRRALLWAAAPALVAYAFLNWDLLVTCAAVAAVYAWRQGRPALAGGLLGVGAALKLYPGLFLAPLILERLAARDWRGALRVALAGVGTLLVLNGPFMLANPAGWWATYAFQQQRPADVTTNSIWFWGFPKLTTAQLNTITTVLLLLAFAVALAVGFARVGPTSGYPWVQVSAAMLCAFLLLNKVHSPQYALWLLPFFALIRVRWGWWAAFWVTDALLFYGLFGWYATIIRGGDFGLAKQALIVGVWGQAALLALLYVVFLSAPLAPSPGGSAEDSSSEFDDHDQSRSVHSSEDHGGTSSPARSAAPSSTPPAGSSIPEHRTTSYSG
jgi:uncharacterized membrane protein